MSDHQPSWMPEPDEFFDNLFKCGVRGAVDLNPLRAKVTTAVEKALAEQDQTHSGAVEDLMARFRGLLAEAEARHKREVLEARIETLENVTGNTYPAGASPAMENHVIRVIAALRAELAALDKGDDNG